MSSLAPGFHRLACLAGAALLPLSAAGCAVQTDKRFTDHDTYLLGPNMSYDAEAGTAAFGNSAAVHEPSP